MRAAGCKEPAARRTCKPSLLVAKARGRERQRGEDQGQLQRGEDQGRREVDKDDLEERMKRQ